MLRPLVYLVVKFVAWLQGQLSMQTAVLAPEIMTTLMRVNMESCNTRLEAMLQDTSSNSPEHWQQVAVCLLCSCETGMCCVLRYCPELGVSNEAWILCCALHVTGPYSVLGKALSFVIRLCCCIWQSLQSLLWKS